MQVKAENLTYTYSKGSKNLAVVALKGVNLTVNEGEFFGIVGHTGSGKSTFIQHLNGLIRVEKDSGKLVVGEFDLTDKKCAYKDLRAKVGMVFQYPEYQLFAETVEDDVAFGVKNFFPSKTAEEVKDMVKTAIELVGLDYGQIKDKSPFELSGGQKRRVAIAGVIVSKPEVLVLDEPCAGLDPKGKAEFLKLINDLHKTTVKTIIIVSHDMDLVAENCDRAAVFEKGKIVAVGSPKEIFSGEYDVTTTGLALPLTAYLTKELKKSGIDIDNDFTEQDFIRAVIEKFGGEKV